MDFFIKDDNVRPGNRGGRDQFKWDDVRMMNNKDRESYLGVSQSIGFLDKGGKWRKRDWWQSFKPDNKINRKKLNEEREKIKHEEEQLLMNAIYGGNTNPKNYTSSTNTNNVTTTSGANQTSNNEKKLTDFQWEKIMKKNSSKVLSGNSINMYDYYDDDKHRAGLGVKTTVSFRTNPYEKNEDLGKLNGINIDEETNNKKEKDDINNTKKEKKDKYNSNSLSHSNNILHKYIEEYVSRKKRSRSSSKNTSKRKEHKHHKHHHRRERSRSRSIKKHSK